MQIPLYARWAKLGALRPCPALRSLFNTSVFFAANFGLPPPSLAYLLPIALPYISAPALPYVSPSTPSRFSPFPCHSLSRPSLKKFFPPTGRPSYIIIKMIDIILLFNSISKAYFPIRKKHSNCLLYLYVQSGPTAISG